MKNNCADCDTSACTVCGSLYDNPTCRNYSHLPDDPACADKGKPRVKLREGKYLCAWCALFVNADKAFIEARAGQHWRNSDYKILFLQLSVAADKVCIGLDIGISERYTPRWDNYIIESHSLDFGDVATPQSIPQKCRIDCLDGSVLWLVRQRVFYRYSEAYLERRITANGDWTEELKNTHNATPEEIEKVRDGRDFGDEAARRGRKKGWRSLSRQEMLNAIRQVLEKNGPDVPMDFLAQHCNTGRTAFYQNKRYYDITESEIDNLREEVRHASRRT